MNDWFTLAELAEAALPGLPRSRRGLLFMAKKAGWHRVDTSRTRPGQGGGVEFSVTVLPLAARAAWTGPRPADLLPPKIMEVGEDALQGADRDRRDAKLAILKLFDEYRLANLSSAGRTSSQFGEQAARTFARAYTNGQIAAPEWVRLQLPRVSKSSIFVWQQVSETFGPDALAQDSRGRPGNLDEQLDGAVKLTILAAIAKKQFLSAKHLRALIAETYKGQLETMPSLREIQRSVARWKREYKNELLYLTDPDAWRSRVEFASTNATRADGLNDVWQIDASPADVLLKGGRHSVYLAIDVWSRRLQVLVTPTPRASAVALLLRKSILDWGVPRKIKTDNGSDFTARVTQRLFTALNIEVELAPPYTPRAKGIVERAIGTFQRDLATCPGFIGHSVADRKMIENRKAFAQRQGADPAELFDVQMDLVEFQTWCDQWASTVYGHSEHAGLGGTTPFQKAASWQGEIRRVSQPSALDVLLALVSGKDGLRRTTKLGVRIDNQHYQTPNVMPGTDVLVRMDPNDLGHAWLFAPDGETWLGDAVCAYLAGLDPIATAQQVRAAQKAHLTDRISDIRKEMRKIGPHAVSDALLADGARRAAGLIAFPQRSETYSTPALEAATAAVSATPLRSALEQEVVTFNPVPLQSPQEDKRDRFRRANALEGQLANGSEVNEADAAWLQVYQTQPEYRAAMRIFEERGWAMFG